jgi:hypothetical protein
MTSTRKALDLRRSRPLVSQRSVLAALAWITTSAGCVILNPGDGYELVTPPPGGTAAFKPVALFLDHRCGTLDCHGQVGRNLRLYGKEGLRLDPPSCTATGMGGLPSTCNVPGIKPMTADELEADYRSAVTLEPEIMTEVVTQGGAQPDRLTLVRKPRAEEHHKGGQVITVGDDQDVCLTSWLAGAVDTTACANAADPTKYP